MFRDRPEAGKQLATRLRKESFPGHPLVLALPRGGVPVGFEVAVSLGVELDIFLVRKIGLPGQRELAVGAVASGGTVVVNEPLVQQTGLSRTVLTQLIAREQSELEHREILYRGNKPPTASLDRIVILVDDGLATGATMKAACRALRQQRPQRLVVAAPVAASDACLDLCRDADAIICLATPEPFDAVGAWYTNFSQTTDEEVQRLLQQAGARSELPS